MNTITYAFENGTVVDVEETPSGNGFAVYVRQSDDESPDQAVFVGYFDTAEAADRFVFETYGG